MLVHTENHETRHSQDQQLAWNQTAQRCYCCFQSDQANINQLVRWYIHVNENANVLMDANMKNTYTKIHMYTKVCVDISGNTIQNKNTRTHKFVHLYIYIFVFFFIFFGALFLFGSMVVFTDCGGPTSWIRKEWDISEVFETGEIEEIEIGEKSCGSGVTGTWCITWLIWNRWIKMCDYISCVCPEREIS